MSKDGNLIDALLKEISRNADRLGVVITNLYSPSITFGDLLDRVYLKYGKNSILLLINEYEKALYEDDLATFTNCIKVAFSKISHHLFIEKEVFYHSMLLM